MAAKPVRIAILANAAQARRELAGAAKASSSFGDRVKKVAKIGAGAVTAVIGTALVKGFKRLTSIDTARTKMDALGLSGKKVDSLMNSALKSVKGTAFGLDEAATTAASASAAGVKGGKAMTRYLKTVANTASLTGRSMAEMGAITNKVQTNGIASMTELNQINDAGIGITQALAKHYGVSSVEMRKMVSSGKVDAATFNKVLGDMTDDAAKKMGTTLPGILANVSASLGRMGASFLSGAFPAIKTGAAGLLDRMGAVEDKAAGVGEAVTTGLEKVIGFVRGIDLAPAREALSSLADSGRKALAGLGDAVAPLKGTLKNLGTIFGPILKIVAKIAAAAVFTVLKGSLEAVGAAAGPIARTLEKVTGALVKHGDTIKRIAGVVAVVLSPAIAVATGMLIAHAANVALNTTAWVAYGVVSKAMATATKVQTAVQWALNAAMSANPIGLVVLAIVGLVAALVIAYKRSDAFRAGVSKAFDLVKKAAVALVKVATLQFRLMIAAVKLVWTTTSSAFGKVVAFFGTAKNKIVGIFRTANTWLKNAGTRVINGLRSGITGAWSTVTGKIGDLKDAFIGKFKTAKTWLFSAGKNVIEGLKDGVLSLAGGIGQWIVSKVPGPLKGAVKKALGIRSPSRVFAGYGENIMRGLMGGIDRERGRLKRTMADVTGVITGTKIQAPSVTGGRYDFTGTRSRAGGNVYVTVNVPVGANPVEAGREVARVLRPYLRAGGTL